MNLKHVYVKNFRSLKDVSVPLSKNNIIIGENNSGKSSFVDVVRIVLSTLTGIVPFEEYDYFKK